ncbi:MAG: MFS transporter [Steroidobacteraceae bacterium]
MTTYSERRTALLFAAAQAMYQTASVAMVAVGGLVGLQLAPDPRLATLPLGMVMVAATASMIPAALFMQRYGRRMGFLLGCVLGMASGAVATASVLLHSFNLFLIANALLGVYGAFAGYYRFAAADAVSLDFRSQALSWVVAGGVVAAVLGPAIVRYSSGVAPELTSFLIPFVAMIVLGLIALALVSRLHIPHATATTSADAGEARPLQTIMQQPVFLAALASTTIGFAVMVMVMTATPIAMKLCGLPLSASTNVIQWHVLGMFVPSFFTGKLIQRVGVLPIIVTGALLFAAQVAINLSGVAYGNFVTALILLGVGWNFLFIGGSTLLTQNYRPSERTRTQAAHDFIVYGLSSAASLGAGGLLTALGWHAVNLVALPAVLLVLVAVGNLLWQRRVNAMAEVVGS